MNIVTSPDYIGFLAVDDDTYDCDCDQDGFFSTHPIGWGMTEKEAIEDLREQTDGT